MRIYKNITLNQVTAILTGAFFVLNVVILMVLYVFGFITVLPWYIWLIVSLVYLIVCYLLVRFLIQQFVFRKIKLIYKMINKSKKGVPINNATMTIDNVTDDVVEWANKKDSEIAHLNELESYRRNFLGNISHELKTPIFSMQGYLHTLLEGGLEDERINLKYVERAAANLERLEKIVNDLEMINKLESGSIDLHVTSFDIKELTKDVIRDMKFLAGEKNITLELKSGAAPSYMIDADQEKTRQVLNNLIINSLKYGKQGGNTKIGFYDVEVGILIEVSDDGIGIAEEHMDHLFDRFYRVDKGRGRNVGGSGLGLAIVKHIVEAHQQTITARSTVGVGSTFGFTAKKSKKQSF